MVNANLIVVPGPGVRPVNLNQNTTVADLINQESLHGRDIIINGVGIIPTEYSTTIIASGSEIFATGSVKGNLNRSTNTLG